MELPNNSVRRWSSSAKFLSVCLLTGVFILLLMTSVVSAQVTTADIVGTVTDTSGAVIADVTVMVKSLATGAEYSAITGSAGNYQITLLPPGRYTVRIAAAGFKTWIVPEVTLAISDRLRLDALLEVGQINQSVEVTATTPALQSESSTLSSLVNSHAVQELPLNGRNFIALAQLSTGANQAQVNALPSGTRPDDRRTNNAVAVNGQDASFNNFLIDGMDDNERFIGTIVVRPSVDAVDEMKISTNLYTAELGRTAGGVINFITKSGTNAFHGSVFEFLRNEKLDARNFFARPGAAKPPYKQNQFGGSFGGPIKKERTFFFADYEYTTVRQAQTFNSNLPTMAMRQGNFVGVSSTIFDPLTTRPDPNKAGAYIRTPFADNQIPASRMDQVALNYLSLYPVPQSGGLANNFTYYPIKPQDYHTFDVRVDHKITSNDSFFGRMSFNDTTTTMPGSLPDITSGPFNGVKPVGDTGYSSTSAQRAYSYGLYEVHTFGPQLLLDVKVGFSRYWVHTLPMNYGNNVSALLGIPGANIDPDSSGMSQVNPSGFTPIGDVGALPIRTTNNLFQETASLTYMRGSHSFKGGFDMKRRQVAMFQSSFPYGRFSFDANFTNDPSGATSGSGNAIASLLLGYPSATSVSRFLVKPGYRFNEMGWYVQDDWRVTRRLTFNIGVRYDYFSPLTEVCNRISNADLVSGKIIIAGQNGVSETAGVPGDKNNFAPRFGFALTIAKGTVLRGGYGISFIPGFMGSMTTMRNPPFQAQYIITNTALFTTNKISEGVPNPLAPQNAANPPGALIAVSPDLATPYVQQFNFTLQKELPLGLVATASYVGALGRHMYFVDSSAPVNFAPPGPGDIQSRRPYYSKFPLVSNISSVETSYISDYHSLQTMLERRFEKGFSLLATYTWAHTIDDWPTIYNNRKALRGNSILDMRHRFTTLVVYELPFAKKATGFAGVLAKGWSLNAVTVLGTGLPFATANASARSNTGGSDYPNLICDPNENAPHTVQQWFNVSCFQSQALYTYGNAGRNILHGPGRASLDLGVHWEHVLREPMKLQFRAEAFNLTNTPPFGLPGGGTTTSAAPSTSFGAANFAVIQSAGLPRNIQLALKLTF